MRVLLANKFFREGAGAETVFLGTRRLLLEAGHEVIDFAMASPDNLASPYERFFVRERSYAGRGGWSARRMADATASIYSPAARRAIRALVRETQPDIAHLHNIYHQMTLSIVDELRALGVPTVMTLHDYKVVCPAYTLYTHDERCYRCVRGHPFHAVQHRCIKDSRSASLVAAVEAAVARARRSYERLDAVIAPSAFLAEIAASRIPADRVHVLSNFLPADRGGPPPSQQERPNVVVFAGRLEEAKGVRPLLAAFDAKPPGGAHLLIAGDGPLRPEVEHAAAKYDHVHYAGTVSAAVLTEHLRSARALVLPALWNENCPMVVLEARAAGTPVIVTEFGGLPELVQHRVDGIVCRPPTSTAIGHAVARLVCDGPMRQALADAGVERLRQRHSRREHLRSLEEIYRTLVNDQRRRVSAVDDRRHARL